MGFRNGAYATVWKIEKKDKFTKIQLSTSKKNKDTNEYSTDFSGFVNFIGNAHTDAASLSERDRIQIRECEVTTSYDKEKDKKYTNYAVFSFVPAETAKETEEIAAMMEAADDEGIPFK